MFRSACVCWSRRPSKRTPPSDTSRCATWSSTSGVCHAPGIPARAGDPGARAGERQTLAVAATLGALFVAAALGILYWRLTGADYFWVNPLEGARFEKLSDWPGTELDAAVSNDGEFVAFLSDRDGLYDMWVTQVGGGEPRIRPAGDRDAATRDDSNHRVQRRRNPAVAARAGAAGGPT